MDEAERRDAWLAAFGAVVRRMCETGPSKEAFQHSIRELQQTEHDAMDKAATEADRDVVYERHRALSAILLDLQPPPDPGI